MSCNAEFGIIDNFEKGEDYGDSYEPEKFNCVAIDDAAIDNWWERLTTMKSYFHCYGRPEMALARWGVTLIPPESLDLLYDIVINDTQKEFYIQTLYLLDLEPVFTARNDRLGGDFCVALPQKTAIGVSLMPLFRLRGCSESFCACAFA